MERQFLRMKAARFYHYAVILLKKCATCTIFYMLKKKILATYFLYRDVVCTYSMSWHISVNRKMYVVAKKENKKIFAFKKLFKNKIFFLYKTIFVATLVSQVRHMKWKSR